MEALPPQLALPGRNDFEFLIHFATEEPMNMRRSLVPLALVGLILVWAGPTGAFSISFIETGDETANIVVSTDNPSATKATTPESALVTATVSGLLSPELQTDGVFLFGLTEAGSSKISDIVTIRLTTTLSTISFFTVFTQSLVASFESDTEASLVDPGSFFTGLIEETGRPQVVIDCELFFAGDCLTVTVQSDFTPVPEPSMGLLVGLTGLIAMGGVLWRRSRRS